MTLAVATPATPPWRQCHASTIVHGVEGDLLLAFFAGTREGTADNAIYLVRGSRHHQGGEQKSAGVPTPSWSWSAPTALTDAQVAHWNPVLAWSPRGRLTLFYKRGSPISRWQTWRATSHDDGRTWSQAVELVPGDRGGRGPVKNPPLALASGRWVAGASVEAAGLSAGTATWDCFADVSDDDGDTWTRSTNVPIDHDAINGPGVIQPTLWNGREGLVFLMRSSTGRAWRSVSTDEGDSWSPGEETNLPNNNSGLCAALLPDGRVICAHNTSDIPWGPRNELALSVSTDDGSRWTQVKLLDSLRASTSRITPDDNGVDTDGEGELSYPTIIVNADDILVSYTRQRRHIVMARVATSTID